MPWRLHRGGRFRAWLGARLGGDEALGDRVERRLLHAGAAVVLLYFALPPYFFVLLPTEAVLLLGLLVVLVMELLRLAAGLELPTIRPYETDRIASYAWYAMALVAAVVLFPYPVAVTVVLGTAFVDPLLGELRLLRPRRPIYPWIAVGAYALIAAPVLVGAGDWGYLRAAVGAATASIIAVAAEASKSEFVDDDLAMTLIPGAALIAVGLVGPGAPFSV